VRENGDKIETVKSASEFLSAWKRGKAAAFLAVEDARLLDGDLSRLDILHSRGIRYLTLTWGGKSCIGGAHDTDLGLTEFGRTVVEKCFELSIFADISHGSEALADEVISLAYQCNKPIIASHSNSFSAYPHTRNLRDRHFEDIKALGGIVGISLCRSHLGDNVNESITPLHVIRHIDRYMELGGEDVAARIETGFYEGHTLRSLINEVFTGEWATYVCANGETVAYVLDFLKRNLLRVMEKLGMSPEEV
jgi:membrane dipeptidase